MTEVLVSNETPELPWYKNRKITGPIVGALATILVTVIKYRIPDFNLTADQFTQFLTFIWGAVVAVVVGDIGFDWLGQLTNILQLVVTMLQERNQQPTTHG